RVAPAPRDRAGAGGPRAAAAAATTASSTAATSLAAAIARIRVQVDRRREQVVARAEVEGATVARARDGRAHSSRLLAAALPSTAAVVGSRWARPRHAR